MNNTIKTILLLGILTTLLVGVGRVLAPGSTPMLLVMALMMNAGAYFFSDSIVLRVSGAREVSVSEAPELHTIVDELARLAGIPKPRVCIIDQQQPNAFATGRNPAHGVVAATSGILELLDRRELRAVLAHEMSHVLHRDILIQSIAAVMATAISYAAQSLMWSGMFGGRRDDEERGGGLAALLVMLVAPVAASLVQLGISRSREFDADRAGATLCGDPMALADALEKLENCSHQIPADVAPGTASLYIVNPLAAGERLSRLFSTHPSTEERVERLTAMAHAMQSQGGTR
ncbi:MAG TPA: zinc metalloprotease HtpX [Candidatus Binatia bacterium]|jgi:heat shock protein HtpX